MCELETPTLQQLPPYHGSAGKEPPHIEGKVKAESSQPTSTTCPSKRQESVDGETQPGQRVIVVLCGSPSPHSHLTKEEYLLLVRNSKKTDWREIPQLLVKKRKPSEATERRNLATEVLRLSLAL